MKTTSSSISLSSWLRAHPLQAVGRLLLVLLHAVLNAALFALITWGPLGASAGGALAVGLVAGVTFGALWAAQQLALVRGDVTGARRRRRWLLISPVLAGLIGLVALVQLYQLGALAPVARDRTEAFERLWTLMDRHYSFFDHKGVDWDAVYARYRPQVEGAEDDRAYFRAVAGMLNELPDGHTGLLEPDVILEDLHLFGYAGEYEGKAVAIALSPEAERAGMEKGALLLAVDGQPIDDVLQAWSEIVPPSSTPQHYRKRLFLHLLATSDGSLEVTYENPGGSRETVTLTVDEALRAASGGGGDPQPAVSYERLDSGVGVIRVRSFDLGHGPALIREFDAALDALLDAPGIIVDVRNNGGGFSIFADLMAGRFVSEPFTYGKEVYRHRLPQHLWRTSMTYRVRPRGETYTGPVAVLTNPIKVRLPGGGLARFSTGDFIRSDGTSLEGVGTHPDLPVAWTREDVIQENDPDVAAAESYLLSVARP
jgi:C-terminal processing protease CtpA/Prc